MIGEGEGNFQSSSVEVNQGVGETVTAIRSDAAETAAHSSSAPLRVQYYENKNHRNGVHRRRSRIQEIIQLIRGEGAGYPRTLRKLHSISLPFPATLSVEKLLDEERRVNEWLIKKYHGMAWESGMFPYRWLISILQGRLKNATSIEK